MGRKKKSLFAIIFGTKKKAKKKEVAKPKVRKRRSHMVRKKDQHGEVSWVRI